LEFFKKLFNAAPTTSPKQTSGTWTPPPRTPAARRAIGHTTTINPLVPTLNTDDLDQLNKPPSLFDNGHLTPEEAEFNLSRTLQDLGASWYRPVADRIMCQPFPSKEDASLRGYRRTITIYRAIKEPGKKLPRKPKKTLNK